MAEPSVTHRPAEGTRPGTFELAVDGKQVGFLTYLLDGAATMNIEFVEVDFALRNQGLGEQLVHAAVEWAKAQKRQVVPMCSFARLVLQKEQPET